MYDPRRSSVRLALLVLSVCAWCPAVAEAAADPPTAVAARVVDAPRIDGHLDEPAWATVAAVTDFTQREPDNGDAVTEATEVRFLFTATTLYIGARLHDRQAARIVATQYRRDGELESDDTFEVLIDTFHDRRNAFYFATNALGTQRDGLVRNEGDDLNWQWDGVWSVSTSRDSEGWSVEMAIPFSTLRLDAGSTEPWGLNVGRSIARRREESYFAPISRDFGFAGKWRVSAFGTLSGITGVQPGARFRLWPFAVGGWDRDFENRFRSPSGGTIELGIDAKVALASSFVADLTYNTDFAQVEADDQRVNLTRFPLFFPEKRTFFLENAGLFRVGERSDPFAPPSTLLFFSRRIGLSEDGDVVPIVGGARVTGKTGPWDIGAFDIVTGGIRLDEDTRMPATNFAALRVKRDVLRRSSIGALYLSKTPADEGRSNQVMAVDAALGLGGSLNIVGFAAKSATSDLTGSSHAAHLDAALNTDRYGWQVGYLDIGDAFSSEMGFLQRTGIRKYLGGGYLGRRPGWKGVRQIYVGANGNYITDRGNRLQTGTLAAGPAIIFSDGGFMFVNVSRTAEGLTEPFEIRDGVEVPIGTYRGSQFVMLYMPNRSRRVSVGGGLLAGSFYGGSLMAPSASVSARVRQQLTVGLDYSRNDVAVPIAGGTFVANLVAVRTTYAFSPRAFLSALAQRDDDARKSRVQAVFRYTYRPGADLFVVYDETRNILGETPPVHARKFLVKMTVYAVPGR